MTFTLAGKELRSFFSSPMGWVILALLMFVFGTFFTNGMSGYFEEMSGMVRQELRLGVTEFVGKKVFSIASFVMLFGVPLLSMRLISEERKQQTLPFLFSAPLSITEIVLGKFLGLVGFLTIPILFIVAMMVCLNLWSDIDYGFIVANAAGLWLLVASFCALGLFMSSLTNQPIVAGIITFVALFALMILDYYFGGDPNGVLNYLSLMRHFVPFSRGLIDTADLTYFVLFILTFLTLTVRRLDADRLRG